MDEILQMNEHTQKRGKTEKHCIGMIERYINWYVFKVNLDLGVWGSVRIWRKTAAE